MQRKVKHIAIVGAGLVGSLLSIHLRKRGYKVEVFEKRKDSRNNPEIAGRSINLALSRRGIKALKEVGLFDQVKDILIPMEGRMMHDEESNLTFQPYGKEGQAINSVSRGHLNEILLTAAQKEGVIFHFEHTCTNVNIAKGSINFQHNAAEKSFQFDLIVGADGAFSQIRQAMSKTDRYNYEQFYIEHGYKELTIPAQNGEFAIEKNALHIWPRGQFMLIALPNPDKSFTATLFLPYEGTQSFESLKDRESVKEFFGETFPDSIDLMPNLREEFFQNPTSSLVTIKCYPWIKNNFLILGDASHAIVPFYGQGMNAGFEDVFVLTQLLEKYEDNWSQVLPEFQSIRKEDADAITDLALDNFVEMRDKVADDKFLLQKKIEAKLHELFPDKWIPLYTMVTFSDLRYSEALQIGKKQQKIMDDIMQQDKIEENWNSLDYEEIVNRL